MHRQAGPIGLGTVEAVAGAVDERDDLRRIHGITPRNEVALYEAGYHRYRQIAAIGNEQEAALESAPWSKNRV
ncbi:hypothetical protein [Sphingobium sp. EM0848]|uniref:hypothetical protein n=1 Tax=Sphingobium sp. EM0848 TaxID=2743473 RepID=UPI00350F9BBF